MFLNYFAVAPTVWKKGVILSLLHRAKMICSSVPVFNTEVSKLKNMFIANSYPVKFIDNVIDTFLCKLNSNDTTDTDDGSELAQEDPPTVLLFVPFFGKCSVRFGRNLTSIISEKFNIRVKVVYSTFKVKS